MARLIVQPKEIKMSNIRVSARGIIVRENAILLVEYYEHNWHFNIPGGGVDFGESLREAVKREVFEETTLEVEVHELLFVYENIRGVSHSENFFFRCSVVGDGIAQMPAIPDPYQTNVVWMPLDRFLNDEILLYPQIKPQIIAALERLSLPIFIETIPD
jgi:8-oxo-dGTP diphosphatase